MRNPSVPLRGIPVLPTVIASLGALGGGAVFIFDIPMSQGGGALLLVSVAMMLVAPILWRHAANKRRGLRRFFHENNVLAQWTVSEDLWREVNQLDARKAQYSAAEERMIVISLCGVHAGAEHHDWSVYNACLKDVPGLTEHPSCLHFRYEEYDAGDTELIDVFVPVPLAHRSAAERVVALLKESKAKAQKYKMDEKSDDDSKWAEYEERQQHRAIWEKGQHVVHSSVIGTIGCILGAVLLLGYLLFLVLGLAGIALG